MKRLRVSLKAVWTAARAELDADVVGVAIGLVLVALGCWYIWRPGVFLITGLVILWIALPPRRPFIERAPDVPPRRAR